MQLKILIFLAAAASAVPTLDLHNERTSNDDSAYEPDTYNWIKRGAEDSAFEPDTYNWIKRRAEDTAYEPDTYNWI